jgi:hypothetical protein
LFLLMSDVFKHTPPACASGKAQNDCFVPFNEDR